MNRLSKSAGLAAALALVAGLALPAAANPYTPRQYYSGWYKSPQYNYHYRVYYYKPTPTYVGYKHNYAVYFPSRPNYVYFYNQYKGTYWGRCPVNTNGQAKYSLLAQADRKGSLDEIPESAFPAPGPMPNIPETTDGATLELPPDDMPNAADGLKIK
jgi:hypothetical protein